MTAHPNDRDWDRLDALVDEDPIALRDAAWRLTAALAAAEHRAARLEAQSDIRGRAVVMYRERAREAEARVKAVRAIHRDLYESMSGVPYCDECDRAWPCPTIRALDS